MTDLSHQDPLVSVVTASFNALAGLRRTVDSVAGQTSGDVEHVIIDGGSDDGTVDYLTGLGERVRWISEPDEGIADALNKGIAMATGEWVIVLQAGDRFYDDEVLARVAPLLGDGAAIVFGDIVCEKNGRSFRRRAKELGLRSRFHQTMPHQGMFCRRSLFANVGEFDTSYRVIMDYEFQLRALKAGAGTRRFDGPVAVMPLDGVSSQTGWNELRQRLRECRRAHVSLSSSFAETLFYRLFWTVYMPFKRLKALFAR